MNSPEKGELQPTPTRISMWSLDRLTRRDYWHSGTDAETIIDDPFAYLEDLERPEAREWIATQQTRTASFFDGVDPSITAAVAESIGRMYNRVETSRLEINGNCIYQSRRKPDEDHKVLYRYSMSEDINGTGTLVLDPNEMSVDGTVSVDWTYPSRDGRYIAYGRSEKGNEASVLHVRDTTTGKDIGEPIPFTNFSYVSWLPDGSGFYYMCHPDPEMIPSTDEQYAQRTYFHKMGTAVETDSLIFKTRDRKEGNVYVYVPPAGEWAIAGILRGSNSSDMYIARLNDEGLCRQEDFVQVFRGPDAYMNFVGFHEGYFYAITNADASNSKVVRLSLKALDGETSVEMLPWEDVVTEGTDKLEDAKVIGGKLMLNYLHNAHSKVVLFDFETQTASDIKLPYIATVYIGSSADSPKAYLSLQSFTTPLDVYELDVSTGEMKRVQTKDQLIDPSEIETEQVAYASKDGTPITMFIVRRKGIEKDGKGKVLLHGYGGFGINMTPTFHEHLAAWIDRGGTLAIPNLRGGGEYGKKWNEAGRLGNRQNVFDDFIAAGEYLISKNYTDNRRLAIWGRSNGGLLTAAALVQRPDLFGAAIVQVPLTDMVTYHEHSIAKLWRSEYGDPEDPNDFRFLHAYSPYHHVKPGVAYPPTLVITGMQDGRVDPMHTYKFAARLAASNTSGTPVIARIDEAGGHGVGKPARLKKAEEVDMYTFLESVFLLS